MKMIKENNQILKKYIVSPKNLNDYSPEQVDIREYSSISSNPPGAQELKNYFYENQNQNSSNNPYNTSPLVANSDNTWNDSGPQKIAQLSDKFNSQRNESKKSYNKE